MLSRELFDKYQNSELSNHDGTMVDNDLACIIGVTDALVLGKFIAESVLGYDSFEGGSMDTRKCQYIDGRIWLRGSYADMQEVWFPYWSQRTVQRAVGRLEKAGLVEGRNMNIYDWDTTKWYAVNMETVFEVLDGVVSYE